MFRNVMQGLLYRPVQRDLEIVIQRFGAFGQNEMSLHAGMSHQKLRLTADCSNQPKFFKHSR